MIEEQKLSPKMDIYEENHKLTRTIGIFEPIVENEMEDSMCNMITAFVNYFYEAN